MRVPSASTTGSRSLSWAMTVMGEWIDARIAFCKVTVPGLERLVHELDVATIELAIIEFHRHLDGSRDVLGHIEPIVNGLACSRWDLVVVEGDENVLGVSSSDAITIFVDDEVVDEVGPFIDRAVFGQSPADTDDSIPRLGLNLEPKLIRIDSPLGQVVADLEGADDGFEQVGLAGFECWDFGTQWSDELTFESSTFPHPEDIDSAQSLRIDWACWITSWSPRQKGRAVLAPGKK